MGSWYKTCGLSQLPIIDYEEVMVVPLVQNPDASDRCYSTAFWQPLMVPFYAKYGDYGRGDEESGVALPYIIEGIRDALIETEAGENKYHDIEVKKDKFDVELFYEAVHEHRLFKTDYNGRKQAIDFVMLRKDIADDILANFKREMYMGNGKGDCGYQNSYKMISFASILEDLPEFMAKYAEQLADLNSDDEETRMKAIIRSINRGLSGVFEHGHDNLVSKFVRGDTYRYARFVDIGQIVDDLLTAGDAVNATLLMVDHLKMQYLDCYMEVTRRNWAPGGHEGSQNREMHGYRIMADAVLRALDREKARYYEENDCDPADVDEAYSEF